MSDCLKSEKTISKIKTEKMSDKTSKFLGGVLGEFSSRSAYSQIILGTTTGWVTGFATMKIGKLAAFAIGGGIILMEIAHQEGYIKIDWSKVTRNIDNVTDRVETTITGQEKNWIDEVDRQVDRRIDRAKKVLQKRSANAKKWYNKLIGDDDGPKINDLHIFLTAFVGGVALGIATS